MFKAGIYTALVACCAALDVNTYRAPIVPLTDGELLPSADDQTYFGGVCGGSTRIHRYRLVDRDAVREVVVHAPEGEIAAAVEYEDGDWSTSYNGGSTFQVRFSPRVEQERRESAATILLLDADGHTLFMFGVGGSSRAPQLAIETFEGSAVTEVDLASGDSQSFRLFNYGFCNMGDIDVAPYVFPEAPSYASDEDMLKNVQFSYNENSEGSFITLQADASLARSEGTLWFVDSVYLTGVSLTVKVGPAPASPTPGSTCTDYTLEDGSVWHDTFGPVHGACDNFYASGAQCALYGHTARNFGWVANEACCACGGGVPAGEEQPAAPSACFDHILSSGKEWHDAYGVQNGRCFDWYDLGADRCTSNDANYGYSSMDACCICGGGNLNEAFVIEVDVCTDKTLSNGDPWRDSYTGGTWGCDDYASSSNGCSSYGDSSPNEGMTANDACCACGGGN